MNKKMFIMLMASMSAVSVAFAGSPINQSELPEKAQKFLSKHFANDLVVKAEKEDGRRGLEYDVDLTSGTEIEFKTDGVWKDVKAAKGQSVPMAVVPAAIAKYVNDNFAGQTIVEISRKRGGFEVELSNGTELKLTKDAQPMPARQGGKRKK